MWRKRLVYRMATDLVANSNASRTDLEQCYGIKRDKINVIYNCLRDSKGSSPGLQPVPKAPNLVCVGRLHPSKGQDVLLASAAILHERIPKLSVEFIGSGPWMEELRSLADRLGVSAFCRFSDSLPHEEVLNRMASAVATIVPSRSEAFGLVNIESMSVGTPVVASAVGGIPELIEDGHEGFLVPADDPQALADRAFRLLTDPNLRQAMGRNARARFLRTFEQNNSIAEQVTWFEKLIQQRCPART